MECQGQNGRIDLLLLVDQPDKYLHPLDFLGVFAGRRDQLRCCTRNIEVPAYQTRDGQDAEHAAGENSWPVSMAAEVGETTGS